MKLENLPPVYEADSAEYPDLTVCRVVLQEKELYHVIHKDGMMQAQVSGKFRYDVKTVFDFPAVGDYVMADITGGDRAVIHNVLPRTSVFIRKAAGKSNTEQVVAANIDTVFLCMSLNNDFNIRRIERYLTAAWDSGAVPVVLLTKTDLCDEVASKIAQIERVAVGVDIITTSVAEPNGYSQITPYLKAGKTLAFVGSSGVGKSTLINHLLGDDRLDTNGLRNDDKGRHTTTHRELLMLPSGTMVIDT
ncbi:MAG: GTPase RsgA, partial [Ruminococcus sp.]|uniref:GTPase RsgA n=1 Tax=Ruminococcus sp. TaxID=41978 RepID=UPI0025E82C91